MLNGFLWGLGVGVGAGVAFFLLVLAINVYDHDAKRSWVDSFEDTWRGG